MRPTRQSLTERNGIPERSLEKQSETVCVLHACHHLALLVLYSRASLRDAMPLTLRLPRPRCGLAMTKNWQALGKTYQFLDRNVLICPAGTPQRRFSRSAISRGHQPAFHMLQHISHDRRSYFAAQPRFPQSLLRENMLSRRRNCSSETVIAAT